jgi:hypothetical protein
MMKVEKLKRPSETRKVGEALIKCSSCLLENTYTAITLTEPVDVYGDLIDDYYRDIDGLLVPVKTLVRKGEAPPLIHPPEDLDKKEPEVAHNAVIDKEKAAGDAAPPQEASEAEIGLKEALGSDDKEDLVLQPKPKPKKVIHDDYHDDEDEKDKGIDVYDALLDPPEDKDEF